MKQQKTIYVLWGFLMVAAMMLVPTVSASTELQVSVSNYDPLPAVPGETVKVWFLVQNVGGDDASNINVELIPQSPFSLYGEKSAIKTIPLLGTNKDYLVDFTLKVDENAVEGDNLIKVRLSDSTKAVRESSLPIEVKSRDATLTIDSVIVEPQEFTPGSDGKITIRVKNTATTPMTDVSMKLVLQSVVGSSVVDLPFAPTDSSAERKVYKIDAGQTEDFSYNVRVYPDATSKVYKIPFTLTYYDSSNNKNNKTDVIGVVVNSIPDISVIVDKTELSKQKDTGSVTLKIINKGLSDVKFLNVILQKSAEYDILSNSETIYVGNLVSDDYQTVEYLLDLKNVNDVVTVPVKIQYRDANNRFYEYTEKVSLNIIDTKKLEQSSGNGFLWVVILIIVVVGAIIYFRRSKKNKKGQF